MLCRHHFAVLGLERIEFTELSVIRRQYKQLARLVHPDKNNHAQAEDAFKKLSLAYDCLSDDASQAQYIATITGNKKRRRNHGQEPPPKRQAPVPTGRQRTPEEIYQAFVAEEERQAELEFQKRGFERVFIASPKRSDRKKRADTPPAPTPEDLQREALLATDLESKRGGWAAFKTAKPAAPPSPPPSTPLSAPPAPAAPAPTFHCLLCRRKFKSADVLARHEALSDLHKANLAKQADVAHI
ncbi:hypothetical protein ACHHYP_03067 [Achlya hypogyna]|uniref:J domain-containing protein n=1 Tax=Achlya hypogyna TaxID=1202772 RepID=A0A1V9Z4M8_ACHHY|nr:hypothetical protein ACHHYP_03067 [Achlya hypogyna]